MVVGLKLYVTHVKRKEVNRIRQGSLVTIDQFPVHTISKYKENSQMRKMVGKEYEIENISGDCVTISGWHWHIKDLRLAHPQKTKFKFNEDELVAP